MELIPTPPDPFERLDPVSLTIGDLLPFLVELFFLPGNWLIWAVAAHAPAVARFLEIGATGYGGVQAGCVSALVWIASTVAVSIGYRSVRDFDAAITSTIVRGWADLRRRIRIARTLAIYRLRERRARAAPSSTVELAEELELNAPALRLLRAHAAIAPGYALPVSEAAAAIRSSRHDTLRILGHLKSLQLIRATLGGPDGETAHVLTAAGRGYLLFKQMMPTPPSPTAT
jgi:hypothetical protein